MASILMMFWNGVLKINSYEIFYTNYYRIFLILIFLGCRKNVFEPQVDSTNPNYLSKEKAVAYLKSFLASNQTNFSSSNARGNVDTTRRYRYSSSDIAYDLMHSVPLTNGRNIQVAGVSTQTENCDNYSRLLMSQNHDTVFAYIFEVVVDDSVIASYHGNADSIKAVYNFQCF